MIVARITGRSLAGRILQPVAVSRLLWLGVFAAVLVVDFGAPPLLPGLRSELVHWDAAAYLAIAGSGYPHAPAYLDAFLPGYPILVHALSFVVRDVVLSGWLVSLGGEVVALWYVVRLVEAERDRSSARFAVWAIALAPTAVFLIAPFTESTFIAAAAAALYYARRGRPGAAALAATIATAIRLTGLALLPALALEQLMRNRWRPTASLLRLAFIPVPLLAYCAYMQAHTGDALAYFHAQQSPSFGESPALPWDGFSTTWRTMASASDGETRSVFAREIAFGLLGLLASVAMWISPRIPRSFALYCSIAWLMTASLTFWRSEPRYILALFPAVILLADVTARRQRTRLGLLAVSCVLMGAGTWVFAQGRWLG